MEIQNLGVDGPYIIEPKIFKDERGYFFESFNEREFREKIGYVEFVQDNESCSSYGVLRGMHFQKPPYAQAKLVRVINGAVLDVVMDLRKDSKTFGKVWSVYLSGENKRQFFVPRGFAHGFVSLKDNTIFQYKCDNFYKKEMEGGIMWNDGILPTYWSDYISLNDIKISEKDKTNSTLNNFDNPF
jgi:dTDP-4-dehydrorhamnose 3,5-epimerase